MRQAGSSSLRSKLVCLVLFVATAACEQQGKPGLPVHLPVPFSERDSAGVLVATTLGARARAPIGWLVDTVPDYQIGESDGDEPYLFERIAGARRLFDGRVVVLDGGSCELRFFDRNGAFLERTAGRGEGPGEFARRCTLVPSPGTDSLRAHEGARMSFFDDRGRFSHRFPVLWPGHRVASVAGVAGESVLVETRLFVTSEDGGLPRQPSTTKFALLTFEGQQPVWEGFFLGAQQYTFVLPSYPVTFTVPFDILPSATIGMDGFFLTLGEEVGPEILEYDTSGRLRRIIRLDEPVLPPSAADLDKYTEFQIDPRRVPDDYRERYFENRRSQYEEMPLPTIIPVFSRLLIDDTGSLWAQLYRFDVLAPASWLVFGPNGEGLGSVDMPPDLEVLQIGRDFVLGVWEDELEVEYVRHHSLAGRK